MNQDTDQSIWVAITDWASERRIVRTQAAQGGDITLTLTGEDKSALIVVLHRIMRHDEDHATRTYRWKTKELGRQLGKAGARIYDLRCQLEASCSMYDKIRGGDYWRLLDQRNDALRRVRELENRMQELMKEKENA